MIMQRNRLALVILNLLFHSNLYVRLVVDAFLLVNVAVSTVVFNKPSNEPLLSRFADSSLSQKVMLFTTSSSRSSFSLSLSLSSGKTSTENDANKGKTPGKRGCIPFPRHEKLHRVMALEARKNSSNTIAPVPTRCPRTQTRFRLKIGPTGRTFWASP